MAPIWEVAVRDCIEALQGLDENVADSIVTDPPYALSFMSKDWDSFGNGKGFQAWCEDWARECLRVLKPGGYLVAFGGTRTYHRLACAIEDAGFEIRDSLHWLYGSGFPKSLDVSKAIDKRRDDRPAVLRVTSWLADAAEAAGVSRAQVDVHMGTSDMGGWWLSRLAHRCAMPTWEQWIQLRELLGFGGEMDAEVWRLNGRKGMPGDAWDKREVISTAHRIRRESTVQLAGLSDGDYDITAPATEDAARWEGWGTALKPGHEPIVLARKPFKGTVAANVLEHGTGGLNIDECRVPAADKAKFPAGYSKATGGTFAQDDYSKSWVAGEDRNPGCRWPSNVLLSEEVAAELDQQSGTLTSGANPARRGSDKFRNAYGDFTGQQESTPQRGVDSGGASRFFPVFHYQAKAPKRERPHLDGLQDHPTVKPVELMRWLVRLVTPPGGRIIDPFAGSGTTGEACYLEGFDCLMIERDPGYAALIHERMRKYESAAEQVD